MNEKKRHEKCARGVRSSGSSSKRLPSASGGGGQWMEGAEDTSGPRLHEGYCTLVHFILVLEGMNLALCGGSDGTAQAASNVHTNNELV